MMGLVASIQTHSREVADQHAVQVEFSHARVPATVPPEVSLCLFRVVQEALHNVVKHSAATHARVRLTGSAAGLQIEIADAGVGFRLSGLHHGLGLASMRERVHGLNGTLVIYSAPGSGTRIALSVPFGGTSATRKHGVRLSGWREPQSSREPSTPAALSPPTRV